jgi:hypothetical protein
VPKFSPRTTETKTSGTGSKYPGRSPVLKQTRSYDNNRGYHSILIIVYYVDFFQVLPWFCFVVIIEEQNCIQKALN